MRMESDDSPSSWRDLYTAAILEANRDQLLSRIFAAKMAIYDAVEANSEEALSDRIALNQAWNALCALEEIYSKRLLKSA